MDTEEDIDLNFMDGEYEFPKNFHFDNGISVSNGMSVFGHAQLAKK